MSNFFYRHNFKICFFFHARMLDLNLLCGIFDCPADARCFEKDGIPAFCFRELNDDFVEVHFHVGERVTNFSGLVNLFLHFAQNSLRDEKQSGGNHHGEKTILQPSGAFNEEKEAAAEYGNSKEEKTFKDCVFHVGESLEFQTSIVKAFFSWNAISIFSTSSAPYTRPQRFGLI